MLRIYEFITLINGIALCFYATLWVLGTIDRKRMLKILDGIRSAIEATNGKNEERTKKGGE